MVGQPLEEDAADYSRGACSITGTWAPGRGSEARRRDGAMASALALPEKRTAPPPIDPPGRYRANDSPWEYHGGHSLHPLRAWSTFAGADVARSRPNSFSTYMLDEVKQKIGAEVERLTHELNVTLPKAIRLAVELGDLRENAEYHSALERQRFVQARLGHLTQRLQELSKIDISAIPHDRVGFGSRIRVRNLTTKDEATYTIAAGDYLDIDAGQVSMASPLGQALLGATAGDVVTAQLPAGERRFRVLELTTLPQMVNG